jgi:chromosome segregation ATPase
MNQCNEPDHGAINAERAESRGLRKAWVELDDKRQDLEKQLSTITAQRDRLAEELKEAQNAIEMMLKDSSCRRIPAWTKEQLAAVKGGSDE